MSLNELVFGVIMPIALFAVLFWTFKPMYDSIGDWRKTEQKGA